MSQRFRLFVSICVAVVTLYALDSAGERLGLSMLHLKPVYSAHSDMYHRPPTAFGFGVGLLGFPLGVVVYRLPAGTSPNASGGLLPAVFASIVLLGLGALHQTMFSEETAVSLLLEIALFVGSIVVLATALNAATAQK